MTKQELFDKFKENNSRIGQLYESYAATAALRDNRTCSNIMMEVHELTDINLNLVKQIAEQHIKPNVDD